MGCIGRYPETLYNFLRLKSNHVKYEVVAVSTIGLVATSSLERVFLCDQKLATNCTTPTASTTVAIILLLLLKLTPKMKMTTMTLF